MKRKKLKTLAIKKTTIVNLNPTTLDAARGGVITNSKAPSCLNFSCPLSCFHPCEPVESELNCYTYVLKVCPTANEHMC